MTRTRKALSTVLLGIGVAATAALGLVFPVPAIAVLPRRRRTDRTELIQPRPIGLSVDPSIPEVQAWVLDLERHSRRR